MNLLRVVGLIAVFMLLLSAVGSANVAVTTDRTVLNADFVSSKFDEGGVYGDITEAATDEFLEDMQATDFTGAALPPGSNIEPFNETKLANQSVSEAYVTEEARKNIRNVYGYLHGDEKNLSLSINTQPLKAALGEEIGRQATTIEVDEVIGAAAEDMGDTRVPLDQGTAENLLESQSSFQNEKSEFRQGIRSQVQDRTGASGDALDQQVQETLSQLQTETNEQIESAAASTTEEYSENVSAGIVEMQQTMVAALTTDMGYETFSSEIESETTQFGNAVGILASNQMDSQLPDKMEMSRVVGTEVEDELSGVRSEVGKADLAAILLPLAVLGLCAGAYLISRSFKTTAYLVGGAFILGALADFIFASVARGPLINFLENAMAAEQVSINDALLGLADGFLGTLAAQALALIVLGIVLIVLGFADSKGKLEGVKQRVAEMR